MPLTAPAPAPALKLTAIDLSHQMKSVLNELFLISTGSIIFVYGMNAILIPAKLFSGGVGGISMLLAYNIPRLDIGLTYLFMNLPLIALGWFSIGKRFVAFSIFGIAFFSLSASFFKPVPLEITDPLLAALIGGVVCGLGSGLILRSKGSAGGLDVLVVFLYKRFGLNIGTMSFAANATVILLGVYVHDLQMALYSVILLFVCGRVINVLITGLNGKLSVMIISDQATAIAQGVIDRLHRGATFLSGQGAYTNLPKQVVLTVTTVTELPRLKQLINETDPNAFVVVNSTFEVMGQRHKALMAYTD